MKSEKKPGKPFSKRRTFLHSFLITISVGILAVIALVAVVTISPSTGTQGADLLRSILGTRPVAAIETVVFTIQDSVHHFLFDLKGGVVSAPWEVQVARGQPRYTPTPKTTSIPANPAGTPGSASNGAPAPNPSAPAESTPPAQTPAQGAWTPPSVAPLGNISGEGQWQAYINDASGNPVAYRTFVQPDPNRPYVLVAVVAFDLTKVQLNYQRGTQEPVSPEHALGTGEIPYQDIQPGVLLAAFNGGFKTIHGHYGVMVDGTTLVPMLNGIGTLVINKDGSLQIGEWGSDINSYTSNMVVVRQNCPLIIHNGHINQLVYDNSISTWGGTVSGNIVTFRSGIGLSRDGKILYYFAGNYLSVPAMASAMQAAGVYQGMQLDINNYYVMFTSFDFQNGKVGGVPLLPKEMVDNLNRFLYAYSRDFFYVTTR